jgi:hypothetical protein
VGGSGLTPEEVRDFPKTFAIAECMITKKALAVSQKIA